MPAPHFPSLSVPVIDGDGRMNMVWAKFFQALRSELAAESSPGQIRGFNLAASDLADVAQFVQSGATAGLGVGIRLGWALCNGNNGTPDLDGKSLRWSTAAAGTDVGTDDGEHEHTDGGTMFALIRTTSANKIASKNASHDWISDTAVDVSGYAGHPSGYGIATVVEGTTASAGSATSNIPASKTLVPLMRVS